MVDSNVAILIRQTTSCLTTFVLVLPFVSGIPLLFEAIRSPAVIGVIALAGMDASKNLGIYQPALACRIHNTSPHKYLKKIVDVVKAGIGFPACHFDDVHIKQMLSKGFCLEDARDYCLMGCVEPQKSGRIYQWTSVGYTNWPIAFEFVFNNGLFRYDGTIQGLQQGDLSQYDTFEKFEAAVKQQIVHITRLALEATNISWCIHRDYVPKPLVSSLVEGCLEKGKNVMEGSRRRAAGARFFTRGRRRL